MQDLNAYGDFSTDGYIKEKQNNLVAKRQE